MLKRNKCPYNPVSILSFEFLKAMAVSFDNNSNVQLTVKT